MLKRHLDSLNYKDGTYHPENQYLNLINDIISENQVFEGRNGTTLSIFGSAMVFSLKDNIIPVLTTKKMAWKTCFKELMWFIQGNTDNSILQKQNVKIWDANASPEFLSSRGLSHYKVNDLGPIYGFQWRHFNAEYKGAGHDYTDKGRDQLKEIIDTLKNPETRNSRRLILTAWNPQQIDEMVLPPCHILCQFNVTDNRYLSCSLYQRSGDVGLGVPFNILSYSILTRLIADICGLEALEFIYYLGNAHIYSDHIEGLLKQSKRQPYKFPKLDIVNSPKNIEDYTIDNLILSEYNYHETIKLQMRQ
tara:strand:+ start:12859 stop:13776 length:918 start_codon:yes stop_codon:yes gene_type:complete